MLYASSLTDVLSGYLDCHLARLKFMARFTTSLLTLTSSDLWKIAGALKAGVERESNYRRIQRFLSDSDIDFTMLGGLLLHLLPQPPPYEVMVDPDLIEVITADREFISVPWMKRLEDLGLPFVLRIRSDRQIRKSPEGPSLPARMYARTVGPEDERALEETRYLSGTEKEAASRHFVPFSVPFFRLCV